MLAKDCGVCIRTVDYSETSQIITFFARIAGKICAIAKGSKRAKSAFEGPIEVLSCGEIVFTSTDKDQLSTLTEYQQKPMRGGLRRNLLALDSGLFAAELLDRLTHDGDPHPVLFDQLVQFIQDLDANVAAGPRRDILLRLILFQLALLREVGLRPNFKTCANCRRSFSPEWRESYFSSTANGLVCRDCEMSFPERLRLSEPAGRILANLGWISQARENVLDEIEAVLIHHFTETLGNRPRMAAHVLRSA